MVKENVEPKALPKSRGRVSFTVEWLLSQLEPKMRGLVITGIQLEASRGIVSVWVEDPTGEVIPVSTPEGQEAPEVDFIEVIS